MADRSRLMGWTAADGIISAKLVMISNQQRGPSMAKISMIGIELAKNVFQIHGIDAAWLGNGKGRVQIFANWKRRLFVPPRPTIGPSADGDRVPRGDCHPGCRTGCAHVQIRA
jgi:hypothetical protein